MYGYTPSMTMDGLCTKVLLISANVGSIFEDVSIVYNLFAVASSRSTPALAHSFHNHWHLYQGCLSQTRGVSDADNRGILRGVRGQLTVGERADDEPAVPWRTCELVEKACAAAWV